MKSARPRHKWLKPQFEHHPPAVLSEVQTLKTVARSLRKTIAPTRL
jgi:hypothetical protein